MGGICQRVIVGIDQILCPLFRLLIPLVQVQIFRNILVPRVIRGNIINLLDQRRLRGDLYADRIDRCLIGFLVEVYYDIYG